LDESILLVAEILRKLELLICYILHFLHEFLQILGRHCVFKVFNHLVQSIHVTLLAAKLILKVSELSLIIFKVGPDN
jgi:hypothetical protein